jgi:hypothetical protein
MRCRCALRVHASAVLRRLCIAGTLADLTGAGFLEDYTLTYCDMDKLALFLTREQKDLEKANGHCLFEGESEYSRCTAWHFRNT